MMMNLQNINDDHVKTTGIFIPISEWIDLKNKYDDLEYNSTIPMTHKEIVLRRAAEYDANPETGLDFDTVMLLLEKE